MSSQPCIKKKGESGTARVSRARAYRLRVAKSLADTMQTSPDGSRQFIRFSPAQRWEHLLLMTTFTTLAVTGMLQRFSSVWGAAAVVNHLFGGVETVRVIHRLTAILFMLHGVYHTLTIGYLWFVKLERGGMMPSRQDFRDGWQMILHKLDLADQRPDYGRFTLGEKLEYYASLWGGLIMVITGLVQWFPTETTMLLPGDSIPISRAIHGWEAVLAVITVLTWHIYSNVIKRKNYSIFHGIMSEEEMQRLHPREYWRILAAHNYLQIAAIEDKHHS